jgi:hypothetical protein
MKRLIEPVTIKALINRVYKYSLYERLYSLPDKNLIASNM